MTILSEQTIIAIMCDAEIALNEDDPDLRSCRSIVGTGLITPSNPKSAVAKDKLRDAKQSLTDYLLRKKKNKSDSDWDNLRIKEIKQLVKSNSPPNGIFIHDFDLNNGLKGMTYDLRVGNEVYLSSDTLPTKLAGPTSNNDTISIGPGEFAVIMTHEYMYVPKSLMGFISVRFKYKSKGLVNISGFHVDPGFSGKIAYSVYNAGPSDIVLRYKEAVFMIIFEQLDEPLNYLPEHYTEGQTQLQTDLISSLKGNVFSPRKLDQRLRRVEDLQNYLMIPLIIGTVLAIVEFGLRLSGH